MNTLPKELVKNRELIEGNFVLTLWKDPTLYSEYVLESNEDLLLEESKLIYDLGKKMFDKGIVEFTHVNVETYLNDYPELKNQIDSYGGTREIIQNAKVFSTANIDAVYDDLAKANTIIALYKTQVNILRNITDLQKLPNSSAVNDFVEYKIAECQKSKHNADVKEMTGHISDEFIKNIIEGTLVETISFNKFANRLDSILNGSVLGKLHIVGGMSGVGKSTFMCSNILYPHMLQGEHICLISNELNHQEFMAMFIAVVATDIMGYWKLSRGKMTKRDKDGGSKLTPEDIEVLLKVQKWINENMADKFHFIDMQTTSFNVVKKMIKKYALLGCKTFLFDTFKSDNGSSDGLQEWQILIEHSKELTIMAGKYNIAMYITVQLTPGNAEKSYLTRGDLSQGKGIIFMAHSCILMRKVRNNEFKGEKNDLKPFTYEKNQATGKYHRKELVLDPAKKYILVFIDKNRSGAENDVIIYEFIGELARYMEIGYANVKID